MAKTNSYKQKPSGHSLKVGGKSKKVIPAAGIKIKRGMKKTGDHRA